MAGRLNESQLTRLMRYYLARVAGKPDWRDVSETIPQEDYIPDRHDVDDPDLTDLYRGGVDYSLVVFGHGRKDWPEDWAKQSISELAPKLL